VIVSVSSGETAGEALATGSGVALSSGLIEGLGNGLGVEVEVGFGFGFAVGEGDGNSSVDAGVLAWNGVEAASCARTRTAVANDTIPITNERIMRVFNFWADASVRASARSRAIQSGAVSVNLETRLATKSKWTQGRVATKSCFLMTNLGAPNRSWR
jgi:hypothetical protein